MQQSNMGIFPLENIFSESSSMGKFWIFLIFPASTMLLIFYYNLPKLIFIVPMAVILVIIILRKKKISFNITIPGNDNYDYFNVSCDFSWESSTETIAAAIMRYESTWHHISRNFTLFSFPITEKDSYIGSDEYQSEYLNFVAHNFPQSRNYKTVLRVGKMEQSKRDSLKNSMNRIGIKIEDNESFKPKNEINIFNEKTLLWNKNYTTGKFHYAILRLETIADGTPFQISEILRRANCNILFLTDISSFDIPGIQVVRRKTSAILAKAKLREKEQKLNSEENGKIQSSIKLKEVPDSNILNISVFAIVCSKSPLKLAEDVYGLIELANHFGAKFSILWRPVELRKVLSMSFKWFKYPMLSEHLSSMLPFLGTDSTNDGVIIGRNVSTGMPLPIDIFSGDSYNMIILGETGSGKTYFARVVLWRMILAGKVQKVLIVDPQGEFQFFATVHSLALKHNCEVDIINNSKDGIPSLCLEFMTKDTDAKKMIIIDEAHLFIRTQEDREKMSYMFRISRHYTTSIFLITQDVEDFRNPPLNSIINNSSNVAIFRNKMWDSIDDFGISPRKHGYNDPESLKGGKSSRESEMFLFTHGRMKKVMIMASELEKKIF